MVEGLRVMFEEVANMSREERRRTRDRGDIIVGMADKTLN